MPGSRYNLPIPDDLLAAARERTLIPFIGAGFSRNIDGISLAASGLIDVIAKELNMDPRLLRIHSNDDWKLCAEYLFSRRGTLGDAVRQLVLQLDHYDDVSGASKISSSEAHLQLAELDTPAIYTTNWDSWIERGLRAIKRSFYVVRCNDDLACPAMVKGDPTDKRMPPWVIKFHGDFSRPETIVLKQTDYFQRMRFDDPLDIRLQADIFGNTVLFLGYSFSDPNIQYIWYRLAERLKTVKSPRRSYLLTHDDNPVMESFLREHFVELIPARALETREATKQLLTELVGVQRQ